MRHIPHPKLVLTLVILFGLLLLIVGFGRQLGLFWMPMGPSGPGTLSTGPITIATDHSIYDSSDTVQVTITSYLAQTARLGDAGGCQPLFVQRQEGSSWRQQACGGGDTEANLGNGGFKIPLVPGVPLKADFVLQGTPYAGDPGRYQFALWYALVSPDGYILSSTQTRITSQTFQVCDCRDCPSS